ncbi:hypothetical protein G6F46_014556 [Rhizopus delemar]|nr:hypothetical protein G6F46_014556 [Rhizopus delemar]
MRVGWRQCAVSPNPLDSGSGIRQRTRRQSFAKLLPSSTATTVQSTLEPFGSDFVFLPSKYFVDTSSSLPLATGLLTTVKQSLQIISPEPGIARTTRLPLANRVIQTRVNDGGQLVGKKIHVRCSGVGR